jgi:hypothetical protein
MKKMAIFVEGETESEFLSRLLKEIAGRKHISIKTFKLSGGKNKSKRFLRLVGESVPNTPKYEVFIYISSTDNRVASDILEQKEELERQGFEHILGLRDLRGDKGHKKLTLDDLPRMELVSKLIKKRCLPLKAQMVIAVMEIETWFLAEINHYKCVDNNLTQAVVCSNNNLGFNPCTDDLTLRPEPAEDLKHLYQIVGKSYTKSASHRTRTIECLDYDYMYLTLQFKIKKLQELISEIDGFLI